MKRIVGICSVAIVIWQGLFTLRAQTQEDVLRIDTNLVNVYFSVVDQEKKFLTSLKREDFRIWEDGIEQVNWNFQRETDRPVSIALLIDISGSEKNTLTQEKAAARSFADAVIREKDDRLAIVSFAADTFLEQPLTDRVADAKTAIEQVAPIKGARGYLGTGTILPTSTKPASGSLSYTSAIWDAVWITCRHLMWSLPFNTRKVIVIVTDGEDTSSRANLDEAIEIAIKTEAVIYVVGVGDSSIADGVNQRTLSKLARRTGGQIFLPKRDEDLRNSFQQIAHELRSQYLITYVPHNSGSERSFRQIRIEVTNPRLRQKLRLSYRSGYYFPKTHSGT